MKKILIILFTFHSSLFIAIAQQGQWTWMNGSNLTNQAAVFGTQGVFAPTNTPPALYEACEWTDKQGNFWLFGGIDTTGEYSDLWEFKPGINQWAWIKGPGIVNQNGIYGTYMIPSITNNPGARFANPTWVDTAGDLWLFGGVGYDGFGGNGLLNDLWRYHIATNEWTWMNGMNTINDPGDYGMLLTPDAQNIPPSRYETNASWVDSSSNLWLFGGDNDGNVYSDMWMFDSFFQEWAWMTGPNITNQPAVYGIIGMPDPANTPSGRMAYSKWKQSNGDFWLFAGKSSHGFNNDLWRFNPTTWEWTWMKGPNVLNDTGLAGTPCISAVELEPRARSETRACWTRSCDNFVTYGGFNSVGDFNDLWDYSVLTNTWTWMSGSQIANQIGSYGSRLVSSATNMPSSRRGSIGWSDSLGNLWMFGGLSNSGQYFNDMWRFVPDTTCPRLIGTVAVTSSFTATPMSGCVPLTVAFTNTSTNATAASWNFGDTTFSTALNPTHTYTHAGTYTVHLLSNETCSIHPDSTTLTIVIHPLPAPNIAATISLCAGDSATINPGNFNSYLWSTGATTNALTIHTANTYTVTVTNTFGCTGMASTAVFVHPLPTPIISGRDSFCIGDSLLTDAGFYSHFRWSDGDTNSVKFISVPGFYSVTVTDANGCTGIASKTIVAIPKPAPVIIASGATTFCQGDSVLLSVGPFAFYQWSNLSNSPTIIARTTGNYIVTVTNAIGCTATAAQLVTVNQPPQVTANFTADVLKGCIPLAVHFNNTSINGTTFHWFFGDGGTSDSINPTHVFTDSGKFTIRLIASATGPCGTTIDTLTLTNYISVGFYKPVAAFSSDYLMPIYTNDSIHFKDLSYDPALGGITFWQWWFGDGTGSNFINPSHEWSLPGSYHVTLIVANKEGCEDSAFFNYIEVVEGLVDIPNVFTPNNDGFNDYFEIKTSGIAHYSLQIFDRWGLLLFESDGNRILWDGYNAAGIQCPDGTYYYVLKAISYSGKNFSRAGFIMLLR